MRKCDCVLVPIHQPTLISSSSTTSFLNNFSTSRRSIRFCAPMTGWGSPTHDHRCNELPGGASLYMDTALWALRRTDGSWSLNSSANCGITLHASIAWRPMECPRRLMFVVGKSCRDHQRTCDDIVTFSCFQSTELILILEQVQQCRWNIFNRTGEVAWIWIWGWIPSWRQGVMCSGSCR